MFDRIRSLVLRWMRVPHNPDPPFGAPGSVRVFRAGQNYYKLRLFRWGAGQLGAMIGIGLSLSFLFWFKTAVQETSVSYEQTSSALVLTPEKTPRVFPKKSQRVDRNDLKALAAKTPLWVIPLVEILEFGGILIFLAQIPVTFAAVRLEFELHWYIVTDRSLRIRTGLFKLTESTMSFANLQQVEVKQDPLQRLLGLADVHVQSAGGGSDHSAASGQNQDSLHTGIFHSVDNATEIRDLILHRLRQFRQTGLGDPEDHHGTSHAELNPPTISEIDPIAAAKEVLSEARALRQLIQSQIS